MSFNVSEEEQRYYAEKELKRRKEREKNNSTEAERQALRAGLAEVIKLDDTEILDDLIALGFDKDNVGVLPIVPLVAVAWADGTVQSREREAILDLAEKRGVGPDTSAYKTLDGFLSKEPTSEYLHSCIYVLREIYDTLAPDQTQRAKRNLINFTRVVAEASGGVFGLFGNKVSGEEEKLIEEIAEWLGVNESTNTEAVHSLVSQPVAKDVDADADTDVEADENA